MIAGGHLHRSKCPLQYISPAMHSSRARCELGSANPPTFRLQRAMYFRFRRELTTFDCQCHLEIEFTQMHTKLSDTTLSTESCHVVFVTSRPRSCLTEATARIKLTRQTKLTHSMASHRHDLCTRSRARETHRIARLII